MRAFSSVASVTIHVGLGAAMLLGSTGTGRSSPARSTQISIVFPTAQHTRPTSGISVPSAPTTVSIAVGVIPMPTVALPTGAPGPFATLRVSAAPARGAGDGTGWVSVGSQEGPEVLTGPLPRYPELLRQAGIEGRVVLEAVVDTTGRIGRDSILVVSATNPDFVAPARQALLATLFRPAFVAGHAVRTRIRIPFEFTIQNGRGHAR
jgi:protein TonB